MDIISSYTEPMKKKNNNMVRKSITVAKARETICQFFLRKARDPNFTLHQTAITTALLVPSHQKSPINIYH